MKNIFFTFVLICTIICSFAQAPQGINYQAVIRDASNAILTNQNVGLRIRIRTGNASGTIVYSETHSAITNAYGLVNLVIGQGNAQTGTFNGISWGSNSHFAEIQADITGGTSYQTIGTQQLMSVPYALEAGNINLAYASDVSTTTSQGTLIQQWVYDTNDIVQVTAPKSGKYLVMATGRAVVYNSDSWAKVRVFNVTTQQSIGESFIGFASYSGFFGNILDNSASMSNIVSLNQGDILRIEFWIDGQGVTSYQYGIQLGANGSSYLNIVRIGD